METYEKLMNMKLVAYFGRDSDSHPRFRLVFSDDLLEKRITPDGRVTECKKYNYIAGRWLLEFHTFSQISQDEILTPDHYEALWLYTVNKGEYYKPKIEDLQFIINGWIEQVVKPIKKSAKQMENEDEEAKEREAAKILDQLQQENTFLQQQLKGGEAISLAGIERKENDS